ncbi:MAG: GMC family oxidoreductase, partial [Pseudomonadota bacterium]
RDFDAATQDLYAGPNLGQPYYELEHARLRFFGGTTNIWGGRCVPLAPIDYRPRSWVPHSGWPIDGDTLAPWLQAAAAELELPVTPWRETLWQELRIGDPFGASDELESWFWHFDDLAERFGWQRARALREHERLTLVLGANLTEIGVNADASRVTELTVTSLGGTQRTVQAGHYVLACGGIENARLLLASRRVQASGIGNDHDQVGRYFMEHPHARLGTVDTPAAFDLWERTRKRVLPGTDGALVAPAFVPNDAAQARYELLNSAITFKLKRPPEAGVPAAQQLYLKLKHDLSPGRAQRALWHLYRAGRDLHQAWLRPRLMAHRARRGGVVLHLILRAEQAPNPDSRVMLTDETDALGVPRAALHWQLGALDKAAANRQAAFFRDQFTALGLGTIDPAPWLEEPGLAWPVDATVSNHPIGGYHHMGTTRMSTDPREGVVDEQCRVHGYSNLHLAGSSVFPTAGWANPTLTIMALALRLADHLASRLPEQRP